MSKESFYAPPRSEINRPDYDVRVEPVKKQEPGGYQIVLMSILKDPLKTGKGGGIYCTNNGVIEWITPAGDEAFLALSNDSSVKDMLEAQHYSPASFSVDYSTGQEPNAKDIIKELYSRKFSNDINRLAVGRGMCDRVVGTVALPGGSEDAFTTDMPFDKGEYRYVDEGFFTLKIGEDEEDMRVRDVYRQGVGTFTSEHGIITCVTSRGRVLSFADSEFARHRLEQMRYTETRNLGVFYANPQTAEGQDIMLRLLGRRW